MGDEELNFTEEEARCWADDPRNQAPATGALVGVVVGCILLLVALVAGVVANNSDHSISDGDQIRVGTPFAR